MVTEQFLLMLIRERVAPGRFELRREADGYVWQTPDQPVHTRRVFATAALALDHADRYTQYWSDTYRGAAMAEPAA
jgi:hypothetical protein